MSVNVSLTVTPEFLATVAEYAKQQGIKSKSAALLKLAELGYERETGVKPPAAVNSWGSISKENQPKSKIALKTP